jgi:hypothetical protein
MARLTKQDIKTLSRNGESPTDCLREATRSGVEYPDAVWLVTDALRLDKESVAEMERDYEECV